MADRHAAERTFWVADLRPAGDVHDCQPYTYALLERVPGCIEVIASLSAELYRNPDEFEVRLTDDLSLRVSRPAATAAIATLRERKGDKGVVGVSLLLTGLDTTADAITIDALQKRVVRELRDTPHEPAFGLMTIKERPLVATLALGDPPPGPSRVMAAIADRCLAAAFFRYHRLA